MNIASDLQTDAQMDTMRFTRAIARRPTDNVAEGLTTSTVGPPAIGETLNQFEAYIAALSDCGVSVTVLDPLDGFPDAHFVEDTAVVTAEMAVITRPGAFSRRGEVDSIADVLSREKTVVRITPPGTVDGGDVLRIGNRFMIGLSARTNRGGAEQLNAILASYGYHCSTLPVAAGLHLKSSINAVSEDVVLTTATFADHPDLAACTRIIVPEIEAYAANTLRVNDRLIMPCGYPLTRRRLERLGLPIIELDTAEFRKMDGGLTCLSLRF